ncbi:MAG: glucose-1-phosphate adenylyltransferase, partial [Calditrichia bacterium]
MPNVVTVILAGGRGARLYPLTKFRSKPAVPIAGRFRLIDIPISNCIHSDFKHIYICTQFAAESLHRHIFLTYRFSMFTKDFITILSAQQTLENINWYQGTADAVRQNLRYIRQYGDYVLILSGDHLYRMDYRKFVDFHIEKGADISISVIPVKREAAGELGLMKVAGDGRIVTFVEKPEQPELLDDLEVPESLFREQEITPHGRTHLASMGIYVFKKDVLSDLLENTDYEDFGREVIPHALKERKVYAYFFDDYWEDIGTITAFFQAQMDLTEVLPKFNFYDEERPIFTHPRFLPGAKIIDANIEQSILCEGSIVNPSHIRHSIIGIRSIIGKQCNLEQVVMMGADYYETPDEKWSMLDKGIPKIGIGNKCEIRRAIIDKNARIGHNCKLINQRNVQE